jgi:NADH:ubiquinone oxidoreductase subunit F (NADH-binding)
MPLVNRVLPSEPIPTLEAYLAAGGGEGLENARELQPSEVIEVVEASGLRGRGGAGFPTGRKWRTVFANASDLVPTTVVVNAAEGEPGTFKDRTLLARTPYAVIEGALIAARAVGARRVVLGTKPGRPAEHARLSAAIREIVEIGMHEGIELDVFEGPHEYLYGEETALLESLGGAPPFPRVAPPYRRGVGALDEPLEHFDSSQPAAITELAGPTDATEAPPALVDNVETLANLPGIFSNGVDWFRELGTDASPGTVVCTVTGSVVRAGVGEVPMGTSLQEVIDLVGGGARRGRRIRAVLSGVSNAFVTEAGLFTPLTYESMASIGAGLGSCGFLVLDDRDDLTAVVAGASRFLAVESCGQCVPCKRDGRALAELLAAVARSGADEEALDEIRSRVATIADGARCSLATQHQVIVNSLLSAYTTEVEAHLRGTAAPADPVLVAELLDISDGKAVLDESHARKQPDWSYDEVDSGQSPADRRHELSPR